MESTLVESKPQSELRALGGRVLLAGLIALYFAVGFQIVGMFARKGQLHTLRTSLDDAIPFVPLTIYLYAWVYTSAFYPVFVIRSPKLFQRVVLAYVWTLTAAYVCFIAYPVTSTGLRADVSSLDESTFHGWGLRLTYLLDPPVNLFPSLHLAIAIIVVLAAWKASRQLGLLAMPIAAAVAISIFTTKQHFLADGAGAIVLAGVVWWFTLRRARPEAEGNPSYGLTGAALYFVFHGCVYGAMYLLFRAGFRPWA